MRTFAKNSDSLLPSKDPSTGIDDFHLKGVFDEIDRAMAENRPIRTEIELTPDQVKDKEEIEDNFINHLSKERLNGTNRKEATADKLVRKYDDWKTLRLSQVSDDMKPVYQSITLSSLAKRARFFEQGWSKVAQKSTPDSKKFLNADYESEKFAALHELLEIASIRKKIPNPRD